MLHASLAGSSASPSSAVAAAKVTEAQPEELLDANESGRAKRRRLSKAAASGRVTPGPGEAAAVVQEDAAPAWEEDGQRCADVAFCLAALLVAVKVREVVVQRVTTDRLCQIDCVSQDGICVTWLNLDAL